MENKDLFDFNRILFVNSYVCNMNCPYCMHKGHKAKQIDKTQQLGLANSIKLFDYLLAHTPDKAVQITFSGGEPLIYFKDYIKPFVEHMRKKEQETGIKVTIDMFTNASLLTEEICHFFKDHKCMIGISYDGHCGQTLRNQELQPQVEKNIQQAIKIMPELLNCASTFYKDSLPFIYDAYKTVADMGIKAWSFAVDTLTTDLNYTFEDYQIFGEQINKIWKDLPNHDTRVHTFDRIAKFDEYVQRNKSLIIRPDGEINIGTTVPVLIPEEYFPLFTVGYYDIDYEKLAEYKKVMGDFNIHCMGRNAPKFCNECLVKKNCQTEVTAAEAKVRREVTSMLCLENWIVSQVIKNKWN